MQEDTSEEMLEAPVLVAEIELSEEEIVKLAEAAAQARYEREELLRDIASGIETKLKSRSANRLYKEMQWIIAEQLRLGSISDQGNTQRSPDKPFGLPEAPKSRKINIVDKKCEVALAQIISKQFGGGDKNWDLSPLPITQETGVTPEEAAIRVERLEEVIYEQMTNTKCGYQTRLALQDMVNKGTGVLKGPMNALKTRKSYRIDSQTGVAIPEFTQIKTPSAVRVDPWFWYPDDSVSNADDCEDSIEVHPMSKGELLKLSKRDDFMGEAIIEALKDAKPGFAGNVDQSTYANFSANTNLWKDKYCVLEYYGPVSIDSLGKLGVENLPDTPDELMYMEIWTLGDKVIRMEPINVEGSTSIPYACAVWKEDPGYIFGIPLPLLMKDNQEVVNIAWQAILDNASISAGPQVVIDRTNVEPLNGKWDIEPFKVWLFKNYGNISAQQAVQYINPPVNMQSIMQVLQTAMGNAEEESGVPLLTQGLASPRAVDAGATGQAIMQENSTTLLDLKSEQWDDNVTHKVVTWFYEWNMQYNPDPSVKVPVEIDVHTSTDLRGKQLQAKNLEKVLVQSAQDPVAGMIINRENAFKALMAMMNIPHRNIVKSDDEIRQAQEAAQQNQQPNPDAIKAQIEQQKLQLDYEKFKFEAETKMRLEQIDSQERMMNAQTRRMEAEAQVLAKQLEYQARMAELASRSENDRARILADLQKFDQANNVNLFLKGQESNLKARDLALKEAEAKTAIETGEGW